MRTRVADSSGGTRRQFTRYAQEAAGLLWRADCVCCGRVVTGTHGGGGRAAVPTGMRRSSARIPSVPWQPPPEALTAGGGSGTALCERCALRLQSPPMRVTPPTRSGLAVWACGPYGGAHRTLVLAAKERLRPDAVDIMGRVYAGAVTHLAAGGLLQDPRLGELIVLPAPTTARAARQRGGDVVTRAALAAAAGLPGLSVHPVAQMRRDARDSVGLGRGQRLDNVARSLTIDATAAAQVRARCRRGAHVLLLDDVTTTGATLSHFACALAAAGVRARAAVVIAQA